MLEFGCEMPSIEDFVLNAEVFRGCPCHSHVSLVLKLLSLTLFTILLAAVLVNVSKVPSSQVQEQAKREKIYKEMTQLKAEIYNLCRPCPWDWMFFRGNCYLFSKSQQSWHDSVTACQEVRTQLVVIKSDEEQSFLQLTSKNEGYAWMGLSDLKHEGNWHWVDGSPLLFMKYWNEGEPNNNQEEDCAEFRGDGWNDAPCTCEKFWICKNSAAVCSNKLSLFHCHSTCGHNVLAGWQNLAYAIQFFLPVCGVTIALLPHSNLVLPQ
uniref:CD209 antigen-like protein C n=1 Tax=Castor canadensis TaxID=51338 RepID=A0A8B7TUB3_CASCN|nr:CD209 antigen-like protein C [Castor canadensis]